MRERHKSDGVAELSDARSHAAAASERRAVVSAPAARSPIARFPASFFAIGLGTSSFAVMWQVAHQLWTVPDGIVLAVVIVATCLWAALLTFYGLKLWFAPNATTWLTYGQIPRRVASMTDGATYFPPEVLNRSFFRSVIRR